MKRTYSFILFLFFCFDAWFAGAQTGTLADGKKPNSIQTAMPFLMIAPDARAGAMGDVGAATSPDIYATHWNPAKMAYLKAQNGVSLSYSPWLKNLVPDISFAYLSAYHRLDDRNTLSGSLRYFSLGDIQLTDINQFELGVFSPSEFAVDLALSRQFGESFSLGTAIRYIRSSLSSSQTEELTPASAFAADLSAYFRKSTTLNSAEMEWALGLNISNIGTKVNYAKGGTKYFLPTNLKLGTAFSFDYESSDKFTIALDLNKLLVPTSPELDQNGQIISGRDPDRSVISGIFGSFSDAPGGFAEEFHEISYSLGTEYLYNGQFALRAGYFYEHPTKGDRQFFTLGTGFSSNRFNVDLAYIIANQSKSPLANTLRFSLVYNFEKANKIK